MEVWKPIPGFEGLYEVSNHGRIKSLHKVRRTGRTGTTIRVYPEIILKATMAGKSNYLLVQLRKNSRSIWLSVHRIVASVFVPNPNNLPQVNHEDGNKLNNCCENLTWCTASDNIRHALKIGKIKHAFGMDGIRNPSSKKVIDTATGKVYDTIIAAAKDSGYSVRSLYHQLDGSQLNKTTLKTIE